MYFRLVAVLILAAFGMAMSPDSAAQTWKAGTAKANITPDRYMWMAGYAARDKPAQGKMTEL